MNVYIDESGDLGWKLDQPYRYGGSSKFLTISLLLTPTNSGKFPKRIIRDVYDKFSIPTNVEIKGTDLSATQRQFFVDKTIALLNNHPEIRISSITVQKSNVKEHIRHDGNKLYNYMIGLILLDEIANEPRVNLLPDPRSIKVKSGNSLLDYLQTQLWFVLESQTILNSYEVTSENSLNIKFIDIVTNIIWRKFESGDSKFANILLPKIKCKRLFFDK